MQFEGTKKYYEIFMCFTMLLANDPKLTNGHVLVAQWDKLM